MELNANLLAHPPQLGPTEGAQKKYINYCKPIIKLQKSQHDYVSANASFSVSVNFLVFLILSGSYLYVASVKLLFNSDCPLKLRRVSVFL